MTDVNEFKSALAKSGLSMGDIAEKLDITRSALWNKITNKSDFRQRELIKLFELLNLKTWEERQSVFFVEKR